MIPGEILVSAGDIVLNDSCDTVTLMVENTGSQPIRVGSHYHFFEVNESLHFDRSQSRGFRLDIPAGAIVRFDPGQICVVALVRYAGARTIIGFRGKIQGQLED